MRIVIEDNIVLDTLDSRHVDELFAAIDNNRAHLAAFLPWVANMNTVADMSAYVHHSQMLTQQGREVNFVIFSEGLIVGRIGIHYIDLQDMTGDLGYWLVKNAEGNGIVTKSCEALMKLGFESLNLNRLQIKTIDRNVKSRAIPKKLGFTLEGILREGAFANQCFYDLLLFSKLKSEWINKFATHEP
jgi:ribosomal-protein-serine acetyltransferase